jgi:PKD repeat protein
MVNAISFCKREGQFNIGNQGANMKTFTRPPSHRRILVAKTLSLLTSLCVNWFCGAALAQQTIYSNFGPGYSYIPTNGWSIAKNVNGTENESFSFTPAVDCYLGDLKIAIEDEESAENQIQVSISPSSPNNPPLETYSFTNAMHADDGLVHPPLMTNSILHPKLNAGTTYWVTASQSNNTSFSYAIWKFSTYLGPGAFEVDGFVDLSVPYTATPTNGMVPLTVQFVSGGVDVAGNAITSWSWNFGDGATSTLQNPSHTYTNGGTFTPSLVATNSIGGSVMGVGPQITTTSPTNFTFITNNGAIIITGFIGTNTVVTIPTNINGLSVTGIGNGEDPVFSAGLTSLTIPNSVTNIGENSFEDCFGLTGVTIGTNVTSIGDSAFAYCTSLTGVTIPGSVTSIGSFAFFGCFDLAGVTIPSSVTSIGTEAFTFCTSLTGITVAAGNPAYSSLSGVLFNQNQTALLECPGGLAGSYTMPGTVTNIATDAFQECLSLTNVTMGTNVMSIGQGAFNQCFYLTSVTIPDSVISIGEGAFFLCSRLDAITVSGGNTVYSSLNGVLFNRSQTTLVEYPGGLAGSYTIPRSVTNIGDGAFSGCTSLTNVMVPGGVTSITDNAFYYCTSLTGVYFEGNAPIPGNDATVFTDDSASVAYYLPGTTGWGSNFDGIPTAPWFLANPLILNDNSSIGVKSNRFGFTISWATNITVVVEACTNLANPTWQPVSTNTLGGGSSYFQDPQWTNYPRRFYRLSAP